jgi:hypothetical protein
MLSEDISELHFGTTVFQVAAAFIHCTFSICYIQAIILIRTCFISAKNARCRLDNQNARHEGFGS